MRGLKTLCLLLLMVLLFSMYRVYGALPEFIVMGRVIGFSNNLIFIECEYVYDGDSWRAFSRILNGSPPNIDALRDLKIGDYVIGVAYGTIPWDKNGWYKGWITIAKLSNDREYVTDIYGDIYNVKPFLGGFRIEYSSVPEDCSECLCPVKYVVLALYDRDDNLLLNRTMYRGDSFKYIYGHDNGYVGAYNIYVKFYNGSFQKCIGPQGHCIFTIHFEEIAVKFRGIVVDASSQYDVIVRIDEVLLDPEGKLSPGKYAHIDIACSTSESNVDWPLQKGDRIEVYAKHFSYCDENYNGYRIVIGVWIYSRDNPYDGYLKKIGGVKFNADIWVDRGCGSTYYIGDPIKIYFKVNLKAYVEIVDEFPDGSKKLLAWGWAEPNKVYPISGKIGPPDGYRIFHIYAEDESGNKVHSQCYINVRSKEMPDLTISFIEYSPKNPSEGDTVTFDISITNIGDSASGKFKIALKIDGKFFKEIEVSTLQPGEEKHISFTWTAVKGDHRIEIIVDSQNSVVEKDEQNNVKTIYIYVKENNPPVAVIDSISPNPAVKGDTIYFKGHGYDLNGDQIVEYEWKSSIDGYLSNEREFATNKLSVGKHTIFFRVRDSRGKWSEPAVYQLIVKESLKVSFLSENIEIEKPYKVIFDIIISHGPSGNYNGEILVYAPNGRHYLQEIRITYKGGVKKYVKEWDVPGDAVPGTYIASLIIKDDKGFVVARELSYFYLNDPDKSYIEVLKFIDNIKIIHIHLQRFRIEYRDFPIDSTLLMYTFKLDIIGFSIRCIEDLYSIYSSSKMGIISPTEPYDVTIILIPKEIYGHYIGFKFETHPLGVPNDVIREFLIDILKKEFLEKITSYPSLPLPLEHLAIISKDIYDSFKVNTYTMLTIPIEIKVEYLTNPEFSYKLGRTIGFYVRFIDPRNNNPIENVIIHCFIGPSEEKATSALISSSTYYLGNGIYRIEIPTQYVKNIYHVNNYRVYFYGVAPGYIGISSANYVIITDDQSFGDISNLEFSVSSNDVSFSEELTIKVNFNAKAYLSNGRFDVKVKVIKKTFFGLLTTTIIEKEGTIGQNNIIIKLKGDQIADWILWWPKAGKYDIKIIITLTYHPYQSTSTEEISEETFYITINIHN